MQSGRFLLRGILAGAAALLVWACSSTPSAPPPETAAHIAAKLSADDRDAADDLFRGIEGSERHREVAYAVLYAQAHDLCEKRDYELASRFLRFLAEHYPRAGAPKEALLLTLFLQRARDGGAGPPKRADDMAKLAAELAKREENPPAWVELASAQIALDRGRLSAARAAFARFRSRWDGRPPALEPYVVEIGRYLASHSEEKR